MHFACTVIAQIGDSSFATLLLVTEQYRSKTGVFCSEEKVLFPLHEQFKSFQHTCFFLSIALINLCEQYEISSSENNDLILTNANE